MISKMVLSFLVAISDYNPTPFPVFLQFPAGSMAGTEVCFDLDLESDTIVEGPESFTVRISPVGALLSTIPGQDEAEVIINDLTCNIYL